MRRQILGMAMALTWLPLTACSTLADAKSAKGAGTVRVYDKPYDAVWDAALAVVKNSKLSLANESKSDGLILAQGGIGAFSWGENVAIYVEPVKGSHKTRVEIINKRNLSTNITAPDWEGRLSGALDERLGSSTK